MSNYMLFYVPPPRGEKVGGERRSRIPTHQRESGDGMDAAELAASEQKGQVNFGQLGLRASRLKLPYYRESQEDEEGGDSGEEEGDGGRLVECGRERVRYRLYAIIHCYSSSLTGLLLTCSPPLTHHQTLCEDPLSSCHSPQL